MISSTPLRKTARAAQRALLIMLGVAALLTTPVLAQGAHAPIRDEPESGPVNSTPEPDPADSGMMPVVGHNQTHVVVHGEDLYTLGLRYKLAIEHLMWANGLTAVAVPEGRKLIIPFMHIVPAEVDDGLVINLPERGMYLFKNREVVAFYPCAIGMGGRFATPTGSTRIICRQADPTWDPPKWSEIKKPVPPGPGNPLGDRWIGLSIPGLGLHGTNQPMTVGQNASHGCMRMYPQVVRQLFDQVRVGMPARIVYEPVKVGLSPEDHKVYVQVFPDVYGRVPHPLQVLKDKLSRSGLGNLVDDRQLQALLTDHSGLPLRLLGEDIVIKVNGRRVSSALAPFLRGGQVWACSDFLRAVEAQVSYHEADGQLTVSRGAHEVRFQVGEASEAAASGDGESPDLTPRLWNGRAVLPVKALLTALNLTYKWLPRDKTLLIYCSRRDASM